MANQTQPEPAVTITVRGALAVNALREALADAIVAAARMIADSTDLPADDDAVARALQIGAWAGLLEQTWQGEGREVAW